MWGKVLEFCGILRFDPGTVYLTLRDLKIMVEGLRRDQWWHTAALSSLIANVNRAEKTKPYTPEDFHPLLPQKKNKPIKVPITVLKTVFIDKKLPNLEGLTE